MTPLSKQTEEKHCTCTRTEGLHQSHCPLFDGKECACDCHDTFHYCYKNPPCCPIIVPKAVANAEEAFDKIWEPIHVGYNGSELDFNHQQKIRSLFLSLLLSQRQEIVKSLEGIMQKHRLQAVEIANASEYDPVNMTRKVANPIICSLVFQHIDTVREISDAISIINKGSKNE